MAKIYISSTYEDLIDEREAAAKAIRRLGHQAVGMEDYVAADERPVDKCLADVRSCQAYVGIIAWRYGKIPDGYEKSITHLEYEEAGKAKIPRLIFVLDDAASWPRNKMDDDAAKIKNFRAHLLNEHLVSLFLKCDELGELVSAAVSRTLLVESSYPSGPPIPPLLPYLSDRSDQEYDLAQALQHHKNNKPRRPFFCVIHGDERECHDAFLERLQVDSLPKFLELDTEKFSIAPYRLTWPSSSGAVEKRLSQLRFELSMNLAKKSAASTQEIAEVLAKHKTPIMIYAHLHTQYWQSNEMELIKKWISLWHEWPDSALEQQLCIFLSIHYKNIHKLPFFEKWKWEKRHEQVRDFVGRLDFKAYNLHGATLCELKSISQLEVEDWVRQHAAKFCHVHELLPQVQALFENSAKDRIPMQQLAETLKKLLDKHRC
jgi:2-oxo-4-hydroxy-4-carboxy--5-ureidoimidazoline (OHCU) decarboxylase